jgi:flagellar biosynthesis/type III secretory pathway protein FliH
MIRAVNLLVAFSILGFSVLSVAQTDAHFADNPAKALFHRSSWAHGYIHGYEMGFHAGNLDLHMARAARDPHSVKECKQAKHAYRAEFGSRQDFEKGYGSGFEVGYADGKTGRDFGAATMATMISADMSSGTNPEAQQSAYFDSMIESGYVAGRKIGLNDARSKLESNSSKAQPCPDSTKDPQFCTAYQLGYRWGYTDGYQNQRPEMATQRASK